MITRIKREHGLNTKIGVDVAATGVLSYPIKVSSSCSKFLRYQAHSNERPELLLHVR